MDNSGMTKDQVIEYIKNNRHKCDFIYQKNIDALIKHIVENKPYDFCNHKKYERGEGITFIKAINPDTYQTDIWTTFREYQDSRILRGYGAARYIDEVGKDWSKQLLGEVIEYTIGNSYDNLNILSIIHKGKLLRLDVWYDDRFTKVLYYSDICDAVSEE